MGFVLLLFKLQAMISSTFLFIGGIGGGEIFIVLFVVLLLFGAKKIPELARGLGKGMREFKDATQEIQREIHDNVNQPGISGSKTNPVESGISKVDNEETKNEKS